MQVEFILSLIKFLSDKHLWKLIKTRNSGYVHNVSFHKPCDDVS